MATAMDVNSYAVDAAPGVRVEIVEATDRIAVTDAAHRRRLVLAPPDSATVHALAASVRGKPEVSSDFGAVAVNDSLIWIGLARRFNDNEAESLGGLFRINRRNGTWSYIGDSTLAAASVTGLGLTRDRLWVGTKHAGDDRWVGRTGLLAMNLRDGSMRAITPANSPLPDALIRSVASDDRILAVATERGLAVAELSSGSSPQEITSWDVAHFIPRFAGDSLVFRLGAKSDARADDEARHAFAQLFAREGTERELFDALAGVPRAAIDSALREAPYRMPGLGHPVFVPALRVMLSTASGDGQRNAAVAIRELGARTPENLRAATREAFVLFDTLQARTGNDYLNRRLLADALRAFGDSTATHWAHMRLEEALAGVTGVLPKVRVGYWAAIGIVADAKDTAGLRQLEALAGADPGLDKDIFVALTLYDSPRAWQAAISIFDRRHPDPGDPFYYARALTGQVTSTGMVIPEVRARVVTLLEEWLRSERSGNRIHALETISRLRLGQLSPALVALLADTSGAGNTAYVTLIKLHGRADAPVFREHVPREAIAWWTSLTARGALPVVSPEDGDAALREWLRRRSAPPR